MRGFFQAYLPADIGQKKTGDHLKKAKEFRLELVPIEEPSLERVDDPGSFSKLDLLLGDEPPTLLGNADEAVDKSLEDILSKVALSLDFDGEAPKAEPPKEEKKALNKAVFKLPDD